MNIQCRCSAIEIEISAPPLAQFYCHCDDCQVAHAAAYTKAAIYPAEAVKLTRGTPVNWQLKTMPRHACSQCGTRLFAEPPSFPVRGVSAYLLPAATFQPAFHIYCDFALMPVRDGLPHFRRRPALFGGSDDLVDW